MSRNAPRFTSDEYNYWVNWALYATLGRLSEADGLMQEFGKPIRSMAKKLAKLLGVPRRAAYRGMVLDPGQPGADLMVAADPQFTFVSWSEDKDVACWFADRDSVISGFVRSLRPKISGWIAEAWPDKKRILFHWSWAENFPLPNGQQGPLWLFARHHPDMIPAQVEWAMRTQKEVILRQDGKPIKVAPYATSGCTPTADLDTRLTFRENPPHDWRDHVYRRRPSNLEMEDAEDRVLRSGATPPLDYMGSGAQGIVFCGAEGHAWKAARAASDPKWAKSRRASLRDEHDWLRAAGAHPQTAHMVPRVYALHEAEAVLERDCPRGKAPEWNARWDDWHEPLGSVPGWGTPEGGRDQWVVTPDGPVIIDGGYAHRRGEVLAQHVVGVLSGDKPRYGERLRDMAWSVYVDTQQGRIPLDRGVSVLRFIRRRGDDSEFSSEEGIARLPRPNPSNLARALARRAGVKLNPDEQLRNLERRSASGDADAVGPFVAALRRAGEPVPLGLRARFFALHHADDCLVTYPNGKQRKVKSLGWLRRQLHSRGGSLSGRLLPLRFLVRTNVGAQRGCYLRVELSDGTQDDAPTPRDPPLSKFVYYSYVHTHTFETMFASCRHLWDWLQTPLFESEPLDWDGRVGRIGQRMHESTYGHPSGSEGGPDVVCWVCGQCYWSGGTDADQERPRCATCLANNRRRNLDERAHRDELA